MVRTGPARITLGAALLVSATATVALGQGTPQAAGGASPPSGWLLAVAAAFGWGLLLVGTALRGEDARGYEGGRRLAWSWADAALLGALTAASVVLSLWDLGARLAPETGWQPVRAGEAVTVEFGRDLHLARIYYYGGINRVAGDASRFTVAARDPGGSFTPVASFAKGDGGAWKYVEADVRTSAVRLTPDAPGGRLNELAFVERGNRSPAAVLRTVGTSGTPAGPGRPEHLVDEQRAFDYAASFRTGFYFDEIYFARAGWELLHGIDPYENTHPPLGKLAIASGIALFGMNPFGWRVVGALFGAALVPLMYLLGRKVFRDRFYAFCAAGLLLVDFMRFAQTRIALIDSYAVFFILLMYLFLLDLFPGGGRVPQRPHRSILLAGVAFGLGAASKWIALYAGGGAALLIALRTAADWKRKHFAPGAGAGSFLLRRTAVCFAAFVAVPAVLYVLSYLPFLTLPGPGHDLPGLLAYQKNMFQYHSTLQATHPFSSPWWSWPLDLRPVWFYVGKDLPRGVASSIASFGNPAVWWATLPAVAGASLVAVRRRDPRLGVVLTAFLFQYLPWVGIERLAYLYHFFSALPLAILCIVALLAEVEARHAGFRKFTIAYLATAAALFALFYPVLSGLEVPETYIESLRWLPTWTF